MQQPTQEMVDFYEKRTGEHIGRVRTNLEKLEGFDGFTLEELSARGQAHDASKYWEVERVPYIWLTEFHRCKNGGLPFEYPEGVKEKVDTACEHHVKQNRHHPEAFEDCNEMTDMDIIDMVCDWTAMSQELGQNNGSARNWADQHVGKKWKFNENRTAYIYKVIKELDARNGII